MFKKLLAQLAMVAMALFAASAFAASVDANKATQAELETVKGIGPGISGKILDERKKGPFKDWQDLVDRVKGVGESSACKASAAGLTVNGASFSGAPAAAPKAEEAKAAKTSKKSKAEAAPTAAKADAAAASAPAAKDKKTKKKADKADDAASK